MEQNELESRRAFIGRTGKIVALGALAHFALLAGDAYAAEDACPGGLPADDNCVPPDDPDKCPGEAPPADYCPSDGNRTEDLCQSSVQAADTCNESADSMSDQCECGFTANDICDATSTRDECVSGESPDDYCPVGGGIADGDVCLGGGATTEGKVQDDCTGGSGDQCTREDDCRENPQEKNPDQCTYFDDDTCWTGANTPTGTAGSDWCDPDPSDFPWKSTGSDVCIDGSSAQDICNGLSTIASDGLWDACPGGGTAVDTCEPSTASKSPDTCVGGGSASDECNPAVGDQDECPGGMPAEDACPGGAAPEDECPGSVCGGDE